MSQTQPIVDRILADAQSESDAIIADAQARADRISASAKEAAAFAVATAIAKAKTDAADLIRRRETVAALEVKKINLASRRNALDAAFERALELLVKMPVKEYGDFLAKLLQKFAEYDDVIVLSESCPVTQSFIMAVPVFGAKKLTLSKTKGLFRGGMILEGKTYDKRLTFENLLNEARAALELTVAAMLGE